MITKYVKKEDLHNVLHIIVIILLSLSLPSNQNIVITFSLGIIMSKQVKIAVIGCGVIGLTTAIEIHRKFGHQAKVVIIADKFTPNTTSDIAAGLWEPYLLAENSEEDVIRWSAATYQHILKLWKQGRIFSNKIANVGVNQISIFRQSQRNRNLLTTNHKFIRLSSLFNP